MLAKYEDSSGWIVLTRTHIVHFKSGLVFLLYILGTCGLAFLVHCATGFRMNQLRRQRALNFAVIVNVYFIAEWFS